MGYGNGKFGPTDAVTNEQLAVMIYRMQQVTEIIPSEVLTDHDYPDFEKVNDWASSAINALTVQGVFRDLPDMNFSPQSPASRAAAASILYRYITAAESVNQQ